MWWSPAKTAGKFAEMSKYLRRLSINFRNFEFKDFCCRNRQQEQIITETSRFLNTTSPANMADALERLKTEFGYVFNKEGQLRKIDEKTNEASDKIFQFDVYGNQEQNQARYEQIAELIPEVIYDLLVQNGMTRVNLPQNKSEEESTFIFTHPKDLDKPRKLLILIHGSGFVRAGQWARSLIINNSLDHGTQIPYIKQAIELGYSIVVTNTNDNYRLIKGVRKAIPNLNTPSQHARYVWRHVVMKCEPQAVAIVAHSYGGTITMELAEEFRTFFEEKVFAIAFTDSAHFRIPKKAEDVLKSVACNWVASSEPLDTEVKQSPMRCVSAGHSKHEWTSWAAQSSIFKYLEDKYEDFTQGSVTKKAKIDN